MHRTMYEEESFEPFNPFAVGPPDYGKRLECKLPNYPTYPPPVYARLPQPPVHANRSVSQGTLFKAEAASEEEAAVSATKSKIGRVSISKAINDEMAASKKATGEIDERIDAGGISQTTLQSSNKSMTSRRSIKTLLASKTQIQSETTSTLCKAPSQTSLHSNVTTATKFSNASGMSHKSNASQATRSMQMSVSKAQAQSTTLKSTSAKGIVSTGTLKSQLSAAKSELSTKNPLGKAPKAADIENQQAEVSELAKQCAEQSDRLKAGIEHCYNRFSSLTHPYSYTNKEVEQKSRNHRMQHWCNNAAL